MPVGMLSSEDSKIIMFHRQTDNKYVTLTNLIILVIYKKEYMYLYSVPFVQSQVLMQFIIDQ